MKRQNEGSNVFSRCCWVSWCLSHIFHPKLQSLSALGGYFVQLLILWGHVFCLLSRDRRLSVSWRLKKYYFYGKINWGHADCPLGRRSVSRVPLYFLVSCSTMVMTIIFVYALTCSCSFVLLEKRSITTRSEDINQWSGEVAAAGNAEGCGEIYPVIYEVGQ